MASVFGNFSSYTSQLIINNIHFTFYFRDLLNRTANIDDTLEVKLGKTGVVVENLCLWPVTHITEAVQLIQSGTSARRVSLTEDNPQSSRSHMITVVKVLLPSFYLDFKIVFFINIVRYL